MAGAVRTTPTTSPRIATTRANQPTRTTPSLTEKRQREKDFARAHPSPPLDVTPPVRRASYAGFGGDSNLDRPEPFAVSIGQHRGIEGHAMGALVLGGERQVRTYRRGRGWHRGHEYDERFMNASRRISAPHRAQGPVARSN